MAQNKLKKADVNASTGTGDTFVFDTSPTLVTPVLGTPASGNLANCTGYPADMALASVQSVTGLKTFDKDKAAMKGTSTGVNTISVANTSATSYTNTIPAKDGTFAMTDDIPAAPTRDSLGLDTDDSPQFAGVNVGHASDTTITRVSAGVIAVEGTNVSLAGHTHEGTAILSTGEEGGTKFLREDGDGTCSWQAAGGGGAWALRSYSTATATSITVSSLNLTTDNNHYRIIVDMTFSTASERVDLQSQINGVTSADTYSSVYTGRTFDWSAATAATSDGSYQGAQWKFNGVAGDMAHAVIDLHATKDTAGAARVTGTFKMVSNFQDVGEADFGHYEGAVFQNSETNVTAIKFFGGGSENKIWRVWVLYPAVA